jgi:hypothetical protein
MLRIFLASIWIAPSLALRAEEGGLTAQFSQIENAVRAAKSAATTEKLDPCPNGRCLWRGAKDKDTAPSAKLLKSGMEPILDDALSNDGIVDAIGKIYLYNSNERVRTSFGKEQVTEHYATIYSVAPYFGNYKSSTQENTLSSPGATRGEVVPEVSSNRLSVIRRAPTIYRAIRTIFLG